MLNAALEITDMLLFKVWEQHVSLKVRVECEVVHSYPLCPQNQQLRRRNIHQQIHIDWQVLTTHYKCIYYVPKLIYWAQKHMLQGLMLTDLYCINKQCNTGMKTVFQAVRAAATAVIPEKKPLVMSLDAAVQYTPQVLNGVEVVLCCVGAALACCLSWPQPHWAGLHEWDNIPQLSFHTKSESQAKLTLSCLRFVQSHNQHCKYSVQSAVNKGWDRQVPGLGGPPWTVVDQEAGDI